LCEFFLKFSFRPFAAPSKCRPVRPTPPRYAIVSGDAPELEKVTVCQASHWPCVTDGL